MIATMDLFVGRRDVVQEAIGPFFRISGLRDVIADEKRSP